MWWLWILIIVAAIVVLVIVLNRRGTGSGDPSYRPDDPRSGQGLGGPPGQWGPGDGGGGA